MKTELSKVYCRPKNDVERSLFPYLSTSEYFGVYFDHEYGCLCFDKGELDHLNLTKIPVDRFIDLLEDKIVPWRLEEIGFIKPDPTERWYYQLPSTEMVIFENGNIYFNKRKMNISTFTELEQFIKFLK